MSGTLFLHKKTHHSDPRLSSGNLVHFSFACKHVLRHLCGNLPVCFSWKTKHIRSAQEFSYSFFIYHIRFTLRESFNQSNRSPRLTCFTHTIEASLNNLRKFLRFFLLLKATTVGNEFSVSGAKNPSPVIFVTRDL